MILWMCNINRCVNWSEMKPVLLAEAAMCRVVVEQRRPVSVLEDDGGFNLQGLRAIVGHDPVATPLEVSLQVEGYLRASGYYTASFYNFSFNLFDVAAEDVQIQEFNQSKWALIPVVQPFGYGYIERPEGLKNALGLQLPYRTKRPVYAVGLRFAQNLAENWRVRGRVGNYLVYEHE